MRVSVAAPFHLEWWVQDDSMGRAVIDPAVVDPNPNGPANIGQAKWMAKRALDILRPERPGVVASIEADLAAIVNLVPPVPKDAAWIEKQKAPLLIGQLKAIARPFYNHLNAGSPEWVKREIERNNGPTATWQYYWQVFGNSHYTEGGFYPWDPAAPAEGNKAVATIGQLKVVFSLRFDELPPVDTDGDDVSDSDEIAQGTNPLDYHNGQVPDITTISGSGQTFLKGIVSAEPIVFRVTRGGEGLKNAPVVINHPESLGVYINPVNGSSYGTSVTLRTNSDGEVSVYFKAN